MNKLYYGELKVNESGMPVLEIINESTERTKMVHLVPFRGYRFQITNTNGEWDLGSSTVVGLGNLVYMTAQRPQDSKGFSAFSSNIADESFGKEFMYHLAVSAVMEYTSEYFGNGDIKLFNYAGKEKLREFIDESFEYVKKISDPYFNKDREAALV